MSDDKITQKFTLTLPMSSMTYTIGEGNIFSRYLELEPTQGEPEMRQSIKVSSDFSVLNIMGWMSKDGKNIPVVFEAISSPMEIKVVHPEDQVERGWIERTYPYRLVALDGDQRHVLFAKVKKVEFDDPERVRRLSRKINPK